jgi:hypothetical protein
VGIHIATLPATKNNIKTHNNFLATALLQDPGKTVLQVPLHRTPRAAAQKPKKIGIDSHHDYYTLSAPL